MEREQYQTPMIASMQATLQITLQGYFQILSYSIENNNIGYDFLVTNLFVCFRNKEHTKSMKA